MVAGEPAERRERMGGKQIPGKNLTLLHISSFSKPDKIFIFFLLSGDFLVYLNCKAIFGSLVSRPYKCIRFIYRNRSTAAIEPANQIGLGIFEFLRASQLVECIPGKFDCFAGKAALSLDGVYNFSRLLCAEEVLHSCKQTDYKALQ